jgi:hypothetical protein
MVMNLRKTASEICEIPKTELVDQTVSFSDRFGYMPKLSRKRMHTCMPVIYQHGTQTEPFLPRVMAEDRQS